MGYFEFGPVDRTRYGGYDFFVVYGDGEYCIRNMCFKTWSRHSSITFGFVTSIIRTIQLSLVSLSRVLAVDSWRQAAKTVAPLEEKVLAMRFPNPVSHPVITD